MTIKNLLNILLLILIGKLLFSPCQCMGKEEETSLHTLPNEMILAVYDWFPKTLLPHMVQPRFTRDPDEAICLRNALALVCRPWHEKMIELTDCIRFPESIGPVLLASMEEGGIRIPMVFQNIVRLDANNTIPFNKGIIQDVLNLSSLQTLTLSFCNTVNDDLISKLITLTTLKLESNRNITDKALVPLTALERLKLCDQNDVTSAPFQHLTNLERLSLKGCFVVTSSSLLALTKLQTFRLKGTCSSGFQDEELTDPFRLREIGVYVQSKPSLKDLVVLPNLAHLTLDGTITVSEQAQALSTKLIRARGGQ